MFQWELKLKVELEMKLSKNLAKIAKNHDKTVPYLLDDAVELVQKFKFVKFDESVDMIRAVRSKKYKYLKNFQPEKPYYLPLAFRERLPSMQELLRMRDAGELDENQSLWFRKTKPEEELFDTENDPHELNNIANDPQYANILLEMRQECVDWMNTIDDKGLIKEKELSDYKKLFKVSQIWKSLNLNVKMINLYLSLPLSLSVRDRSA